MSSDFAHEFRSEFTKEERQFIREAAAFFEDPGYFVHAMNWMGVPFEYAQRRLPQKAREVLSRATKAAVEKALQVSIKTMPGGAVSKSFGQATEDSRKSGLLHTLAAGAVGAIGGGFGMLALPLELPAVTVVMLRSIAEIAQNYGNNLEEIETRLECLYVFSLGGRSEAPNSGEEMESAYYASRLAFGEMIKTASAFIAGSSVKEVLAALENGTAPVLGKLVGEIASQLEVRVSKKVVAQAAPVIGAVGGASINALFMNYFQDCARFHFGLRKLERGKGYDATHALFDEARREFKRYR
jgi:uncharacterized membrane protein YeaQ/YmgE (transglycosylase-associated protein family)